MFRKQYYQTLDLEIGATEEEIKSAYRKLALKWHPDKNLGNEAEAAEKFKEISVAYEILIRSINEDRYDPDNTYWEDYYRREHEEWKEKFDRENAEEEEKDRKFEEEIIKITRERISKILEEQLAEILVLPEDNINEKRKKNWRLKSLKETCLEWNCEGSQFFWERRGNEIEELLKNLKEKEKKIEEVIKKVKEEIAQEKKNEKTKQKRTKVSNDINNFMIEKNISLTDSYLEEDVKTELSNKLAKIHNCEINKLSVIEVETRNFIEQIAEAKKEKKALESKIKERKNKILKIENNLQEIIEKKKHFSVLRIHKKTEYEKFCTVCQNKIAEFKKEINLTSDKLDIKLKSLDELAFQIKERLEQSEKIVQNNFFFSFLS